MFNIILAADSYKLSHWKQTPPRLTHTYCYYESRVGAKFDTTIFFGLQYLIKKYLIGQVVTEEKINQAKLFCKMHFGRDDVFNEEGWRYILTKYNGFLPIVIKAVPEGTEVPVDNMLFSVENTDPKCAWLPGHLETLLVQLWYPSVVATLSNRARKVILAGLEESGSTEQIEFKLHDFGFRGSTSVESAGIGGLAHLLNFKGTDTIQAITTGIEYYDSGICGFSIPAMEHSTVCSWGVYGEADAFLNMMRNFQEGIIAIVSDTYDINNACSEIYGEELRDWILARKGTLVVRPDSGDIIEMSLRVVQLLGEKFGTAVNQKGYRVLPDFIRVIYGDGCTLETIRSVVDNFIYNGYSIDNIAFGMGGGLLQKVNRDTQRAAYKASNVTIDGRDYAIAKKSKMGKLKLIKEGRIYRTIPESEPGTCILDTVYKNGELLINETFDTVRNRIK